MYTDRQQQQVIEEAVIPDFHQLSRPTEMTQRGGTLGCSVSSNGAPLQHWAAVTVHCEGELVQLGGAAAPSSVATCLIVVFIYFGVQFRSRTYSLIGIKRLVTVTLIEGRI